MSRNALVMTAVMAALLASAVALCFCGCDDSSADTAYDALAAPSEPPAEPEAACETPAPAEKEPPKHFIGAEAEHDKAVPPPFPPGRQPEGPPPSDSEPPKKPRDGGNPPVIVIDASGRPHSPEDILEEYSVIYKEKVALEMDGNEVVVFDETLFEEAGEELAGVIATIFGESLTASIPEEAAVVTPGSSAQSADSEFLLLVLKHASRGSWIESLVMEMLDEQLRTSPAYRGMVPPDSRQYEVPDPPPVKDGEGTEDPNIPRYIGDVPLPTPSSVSYLADHGFDSGASF